MKSAVFVATGEPLAVEEVTWLPPGDDDVVVRVTASGICKTDHSVLHGHIPLPPPMVLGHEGVGVVEEVGRNVTGVAVGDRVVGSFVPTCGRCWFCVQGFTNLCNSKPDASFVPRVDRGAEGTASAFCGLGTFSERITVDQTSVVPVHSTLPDEQLALIGCGITTGVGAAINTARVTPGSTVAVVGCGGVGLSVLQGARIGGAAQIIAIDPLAAKRELATKFGATSVVDPSDGDVVEQVKASTSGRGVDFAFDVVGRSETTFDAWNMTRHGGTITLVGVPGRDDTLRMTPITLVASERRLLGCLYGSANVRRDFPRFAHLAECGRLDLAAMVTRVVGLDQVNDALADLQSGAQVRSVIVPSAS